jgi:hypothetical protein
MKKIILIGSICLFAFSIIKAQNNVIHVADNANIIADLNLSKLLDINLEKNEKTDKIPGFRIQVASSNNRFKIDEEREVAKKELQKFHTHVIYDQPYYKLRLGDYKSRLDAMKHLQEILEIFSSAFIVKDEIKVK